MKFRIRVLAILCVLALLTVGALPALAEEPAENAVGYTPEGITVGARSVLVVYLGSDIGQDTVLYGKQPEYVTGAAALVRMMMAAYAMTEMRDRNIDPDTLTGTYTSSLFYGYVGGTGLSVANMGIGETWTLRDLLTVSLTTGAADAAVTVAATISGTVEDFVAGMNRLAGEIGCTASSFANVTGDDALNQYTTAMDLYRITRYAMQFPEFESYVSHAQYEVKPVSGGNTHNYVTSNNMMRSTTNQYYEPMVFGRVGYTDVSGWSLLSVSRDSGYEYMVIALGCASGGQYTDTRALYGWVFNNFTYSILLSRSEILSQIDVDLAWDRDKINLVPADDLTAVVYNKLTEDSITRRFTIYEPRVDAPVEKGAVFGKVELFCGIDQKIGEMELVAAESAERSRVLEIWRVVRGVLTNGWFYACVGALLLFIGVIVLLKKPKRRR